MKVMILGGDGFCGWPASLFLSQSGHEVTIVDNLSRREIDAQLGTHSLAPISDIDVRLEAWHEVSGQKIDYLHIDIAKEYAPLCQALRALRPDVIIHFAEQRSAPYSMLSSEASRYTVTNNISATHNLLAAVLETGIDPHLIHLGSVGVYGYGDAGLRLPEGYLSVTAHGPDGRDVEKEILYPGQPVSIYHMTKAQDQLLFAFYTEKFGYRITDLHQGIVWGTQSEETLLDPRLANRFDYDPVYGTVVNRFLVQAAIGHALTVYGTGEQTRGYIHLRDTLACIEHAIATPPKKGDRVAIINQVAETLSVGDLARQVAEITGAKIDYLANPRQEPARNALDVDRTTFLGLKRAPLSLATQLKAEAQQVSGLDLTRVREGQISPAGTKQKSMATV